MDLVERLRDNAERGRYAGSDYMEAAAEIERLTATLAHVSAQFEQLDRQYQMANLELLSARCQYEEWTKERAAQKHMLQLDEELISMFKKIMGILNNRPDWTAIPDETLADNEQKAAQFGYKFAACLACGNHDTPACDACEIETPNGEVQRGARQGASGAAECYAAPDEAEK